ncbi:MAG: M3 family oligoendopeptidase [Bacteroidia bacterium]
MPFMQQYLEITDAKARRTWIPQDFVVSDWPGIEIYYERLLAQEPASVEDLKTFLQQRNELEAIFWEDYAWRYIRKTCDTQDAQIKEAYAYFVQHMLPPHAEIEDRLNRKIAANPYFDELPAVPYLTFTRQLRREIGLFRKENIPLRTEDETIAQGFQELASSMTIEYKGDTLTLQQAAKYLEAPDRTMREEVWHKIAGRRLQDRQKLEDIFSQLVDLRHRQAINAGYDTFTTYKFDLMGRFDYTLADTHAFHDAVEQVVKPVYTLLMEERRERMGLDRLRPWDLSVDIFGPAPLKPFDTGKDLLQKTIETLSRLRPELGEMLRIMDQRGFLDLDTRVGKAPGGYNYPLMETGIPFIFMNAAGTQTDVTTMLHESGHAIHSFLTRDLPLNELKQPPSEVAELASMTMELLTLDHYDLFYADTQQRTRAQKEQLLRCITIFPWIAAVDAFQQWAYNHPDHDSQTRSQVWLDIYQRFHGEAVDWTGYEEALASLWLKQGHIFDVPFYYIEYGIAQLGALAIWRNYRQHPEQGIGQYLQALQVGYAYPIPEVYSQAGIRFDFSIEYVRSCIDFCLDAYMALKLD